MLEKYLGLLPYNPSLIHQFAFYARRLHAEASVRRIGFVFIVLAFFVQFFAVVSPPQPTMARSNNDLVDGGVSSASDATGYCTHNLAHYGDILNYYGISCSDVAKSVRTTIRSTDFNKKLYSLGRLPYGKKGETPANIKGASYYWRYLWSWDTGAYSTYQALKVVSSTTHKVYYILFNCGNLTSIGLPTPPLLPAPKPAPSPTPVSTPPPIVDVCPQLQGLQTDYAECKPCSEAQSITDVDKCLLFSKRVTNKTQQLANANNTTANPGDILLYTLTVHNTGELTVPQFVVQENLSDVLDYASVADLDGGILDNSSGIVTWPAADIASQASLSKTITVQIKNPLPSTPTSTSDPGHFDLVMTNVYGNTVTVNLHAPAIKTAEYISHKLPNTGPGTSMAIAFIITLATGYFTARSRLLAEEAMITLNEAKTTGAK